MAGSVNKVILVGNLGRDPEVRSFPNGGKVVNLRVATSERWRDKQTGENKERTEWHSVAIFNENLGRIAEQYLRKGSKVYLEGQLETRKWQDQSGQDRYTTEVVLRQFRGELTLLDGRGEGAGAGGGDYDQDRGSAGGAGRGAAQHDRRRDPVLGAAPQRRCLRRADPGGLAAARQLRLAADAHARGDREAAAAHFGRRRTTDSVRAVGGEHLGQARPDDPAGEIGAGIAAAPAPSLRCPERDPSRTDQGANSRTGRLSLSLLWHPGDPPRGPPARGTPLPRKLASELVVEFGAASAV